MTVASLASTMMTMRAEILRNQTATEDTWGQPDAPSFSTHATDVACRVWTRTRQKIVDGAKIAHVEETRCSMVTDQDVLEADRLGDITDRLGVVLFGGQWEIRDFQRRPGHLEMELKRVET